MFVPTYSRICVMNSAPSRVEIDFPRLSSQLPFTRGQDRRTGEGILDCPKAKDRTPGLAHGESTEIIMSPTVRNAVPSRSSYNQFVRAYRLARCSSALCLPDDCVSKSD